MQIIGHRTVLYRLMQSPQICGRVNSSDNSIQMTKCKRCIKARARYELFRKVNKFLLSLNPILGNDGIDSDDDSPSVSEKKPDSKKAEFRTFSRYMFVLFLVTFLKWLHL